MSTLVVKCSASNTVLVSAQKDSFSQEDIDSYRNTTCSDNASHQIEVTVDNVPVNFSSLQIVIPDVTPRQIRQALILSGVSLSQIDAALNSLPDPMKSLAQAEWEYSVAFERHRPLVNSVAQMLGWSNAQIDALWLFAHTL